MALTPEQELEFLRLKKKKAMAGASRSFGQPPNPTYEVESRTATAQGRPDVEKTGIEDVLGTAAGAELSVAASLLVPSAGPAAGVLPRMAAFAGRTLAGAAGAGTGEALRETLQHEPLQPGKIKTAAAVDALAGSLGEGAVMAAKGVKAMGKSIVRNVLATGKGLDREVVDTFMETPLKGARSKAGSVDNAVNRVKTAVLDAKKAAGKRVEELRRQFGFELPLQKTEARMLGAEERKLPEVLADVNQFIAKPPQGGQLDLDTAFTLRDELGKQFKEGSFSDLERKVLTDKKRALDDLIRSTRAGKALLNVNKAYAGIMEELDTFGKALDAPELTEKAILDVVKAGDRAVGKIARMRNALKKIVPEDTLRDAAQAVAEKQFQAGGRGGIGGSQRAVIAGAAAEAAEGSLGTSGVRAAAKGVEGLAALPSMVLPDKVTPAGLRILTAIQRRKEASRGE